MRAIVTTQYGAPEVLELREVKIPLPANDEVLLKLYASSVNTLDLANVRGPLIIRLASGGLFKPRQTILGADVAGRVQVVGKDVMHLHPGDEVFGGSFGRRGLGGFAEYACVLGSHLALKPATVSFEDAAALPVAATTALQGLRDQGRIQRGQRVLVDGASGGVGTFAVQIAKSFGAHVTAVCSTKNVATARSIGADHVIDYTARDFTQGDQHYDLILAANAHHSIFAYRRALSPDGILVMAGGGLLEILQVALLGSIWSWIGRKKMYFFIAKINTKDLVLLADLLANKKVIPVIEKLYPLSETAEAIRYLGQGHARGKVVITVGHDNGI